MATVCSPNSKLKLIIFVLLIHLVSVIQISKKKRQCCKTTLFCKKKANPKKANQKTKNRQPKK